MDHVNAVEPAKTAFAMKAQIRRAIEAAGIPYTYVPSNCFAAYYVPTLAQFGLTAPPRDKITILGDGNAKGNKQYAVVNSLCEIRGGKLISLMVLTFILLQQLFSIRKMILEPTPSKQWMILEH